MSVTWYVVIADHEIVDGDWAMAQCLGIFPREDTAIGCGVNYIRGFLENAKTKPMPTITPFRDLEGDGGYYFSVRYISKDGGKEEKITITIFYNDEEIRS